MTVFELIDRLSGLSEQISHDIPFYIYGDNQVVQVVHKMSTKLLWLQVELNTIIEELKNFQNKQPNDSVVLKSNINKL